MAIYHRYPLDEIGGYWLHFFVQYIRDLAPLIEPAPDPYPPRWWEDYYKSWAWYNNLDAQKRPNTYLLELYWAGCKKLLGGWIEEVGTWARDTAQNWTRTLVGYVERGFSTVQAWVHDIDARVGQALPWFAATVGVGLDWLYWRLPAEIRGGSMSWGELWESIKAAVRQWAQDRYDAIRTWYNSLRVTLENTVSALQTWWNTAHAWLDDFRLNAAARVAGWLGAPWAILSGLAEDLRQFYNAVWSPYRTTLVELIRDPLGWLYQRAADYLAGKW